MYVRCRAHIPTAMLEIVVRGLRGNAEDPIQPLSARRRSADLALTYAGELTSRGVEVAPWIVPPELEEIPEDGAEHRAHVREAPCLGCFDPDGREVVLADTVLISHERGSWAEVV